jgi:xanthine dehydrogenase YagR molybdenum-binding subunit
MSKEKETLYLAQAVPVPETPKPKQDPSGWKKTEVIGKRLPRVDAYERVSGSAVYPSDTHLPGMLYGAILRCPYAHARVLTIDTRSRKIPRSSGRDHREHTRSHS